MGYSGLIYAAIVAGWAAILVPRWIRRNEEVERAREEDVVRGVRVLDRPARPVKPGHATGFFTFSAPEGSGADDEPGVEDQPAPDLADDSDESAAVEISPLPGAARFGVAARRRRRVLLLLSVALVVVVAGTLAGRLSAGVMAVPASLLAGFIVLARRAAVAEQRRRARLIRAMRRQQTEAKPEAPAEPRRRVAVLDLPEPSEPADPDAWEPVPVPLPTYLTKAKAPPQAVRKIDLSSAGAWTSGRLEPARSVELPPARPESPASTVAEEPERRRAVGD